MRARLFLWIFLFSFTLAQVQAQAAAPELQSLFREAYPTSLYVEGRCGQNVMRFFELAQARGVDLRDVNMLRITSKGSVFLEGFLAFETRARGNLNRPAETMWYFHVVTESGGMILDFDFFKPTVLPAAEYFERMFYPAGRQSLGYVRNTPENRARIYEDIVIESTPALDYIEYLRSGRQPKVTPISLKQYLGRR